MVPYESASEAESELLDLKALKGQGELLDMNGPLLLQNEFGHH